MDLNTMKADILDVIRDELTEKDYAIFILRTIGGMNCRDIGTVLKISKDTVLVRHAKIISLVSRQTHYVIENNEIVDNHPGDIVTTTAEQRNRIRREYRTMRVTA